MHTTGAVDGRLLTRTSEPCGHRFSGDLTGFGALASKGRCVTSINRADSANVELSSMSGDSARDGNDIMRLQRRIARLSAMTGAPLYKFLRGQKGPRENFFWSFDRDGTSVQESGMSEVRTNSSDKVRGGQLIHTWSTPFVQGRTLCR
jgi:hypothetical protein